MEINQANAVSAILARIAASQQTGEVRPEFRIESAATVQSSAGSQAITQAAAASRIQTMPAAAAVVSDEGEQALTYTLEQLRNARRNFNSTASSGSGAIKGSILNLYA
jgi:hypothetical protein